MRGFVTEENIVKIERIYKEPIPQRILNTEQAGIDLICFLQALFGKSCKVFLENVASPNWRKLQSLGWLNNPRSNEPAVR